MRQYYDVFCLLENEEVLNFIGTEEYISHKEKRFPNADLKTPIAQSEAFLLKSPELREDFRKRYIETSALYYSGQPDFDELLTRIDKYISNLWVLMSIAN